MPAIPHVIRRGARYSYRRRLPVPYPVKFGFKCAAQRAGAAPVLSIYNVSYSYVGHVTLLR